MKLAQALSAQKAISEEVAHRRRMEQERSWTYRSFNTTPDAKLEANFDFEANHERIKELSRLHTRLGQAISNTNLQCDVIGIADADFVGWI